MNFERLAQASSLRILWATVLLSLGMAWVADILLPALGGLAALFALGWLLVGLPGLLVRKGLGWRSLHDRIGGDLKGFGAGGSYITGRRGPRSHRLCTWWTAKRGRRSIRLGVRVQVEVAGAPRGLWFGSEEGSPSILRPLLRFDNLTGDDVFDAKVDITGNRHQVLAVLDAESRALLLGAVADGVSTEGPSVCRHVAVPDFGGTSDPGVEATLRNALDRLHELAAHLELTTPTPTPGLIHNVAHDPCRPVRITNLEALIDLDPARVRDIPLPYEELASLLRSCSALAREEAAPFLIGNPNAGEGRLSLAPHSDEAGALSLPEADPGALTLLSD